MIIESKLQYALKVSVVCWRSYCGASGKESISQFKSWRRLSFDPWIRKIPWRRKWQPILVFLPGEFDEQRSLVSYSPLGCKESDMTEQLTRTRFFATLAELKSFKDIILTPKPKTFLISVFLKKFTKSWLKLFAFNAIIDIIGFKSTILPFIFHISIYSLFLSSTFSCLLWD